MSLDKAIKHGKEHRKPYTGSKVYFASCRNHGECPWCKENRKHKMRDKHPPEQDEDEEYCNYKEYDECIYNINQDRQIKGRRMTDAESMGMLFDDPLDVPCDIFNIVRS